MNADSCQMVKIFTFSEKYHLSSILSAFNPPPVPHALQYALMYLFSEHDSYFPTPIISHTKKHTVNVFTVVYTIE